MNITSSATGLSATGLSAKRPSILGHGILLLIASLALALISCPSRSVLGQQVSGEPKPPGAAALVAHGSQAPVSEAEIDALVAQLGANTYRSRERAELRLESLGLLAFEALLDQRDHEDIEIRLRSRRLVEKLRTRFLREGVDPALKRSLENYAQRNEEGRELTIEILASLLPQQAVNELARIARFEESARISKQAALAIMKVPYPADSHGRIERAERLERAIGYGDRTAIRWLRLYVAALRGETVGAKTTVELWQTFVENDTKLTREEQSDASSVEIVVDMRHLLGDFHELHGDHALAFEARKQVNQAVFADDDEVIRWLDWLLRRSAWPAVIDLAERNEARFDRKSVLLYGLAEAQLRMGVDPVTRDATCDRANTVMPKNDDTERYFTAAYLQDERGLFDWAEREYRHIIKHGGQDSVNRAFAANRLAEMLYNDGHGKEAYDVMHALMEEMKESEIVRQVVEDRWGSNLAALKSRMNLYLATHHRDQKNHQREREYLKRGLKLDPTEADVLIAMYRVKDADEEWRKKTRRAINNTIESFRRNIYDSRRVSEGAGNNENNGGQSLSGALNQLAWLVANTEGDYAEALRMSKKSLELDPGDAGVMDTLARCYYSVNDYENGVKYQRWAVQRNPHNGLMHKQLDLFEKALATSRSDAPDGADR